MKELTKAEEQVMQALWKLEKGFVKDIIIELPKPSPAYTTVSTVVRILEEKGFVGHKVYGNIHEYFPLISKQQYGNYTFKNMFKNYFNSSVDSLMSFFVEEKNIDIKELDALVKQLKKNRK